MGPSSGPTTGKLCSTPFGQFIYDGTPIPEFVARCREAAAAAQEALKQEVWTWPDTSDQTADT